MMRADVAGSTVYVRLMSFTVISQSHCRTAYRTSESISLCSLRGLVMSKDQS